MSVELTSPRVTQKLNFQLLFATLAGIRTGGTIDIITEMLPAEEKIGYETAFWFNGVLELILI